MSIHIAATQELVDRYEIVELVNRLVEGRSDQRGEVAVGLVVVGSQVLEDLVGEKSRMLVPLPRVDRKTPRRQVEGGHGLAEGAV